MSKGPCHFDATADRFRVYYPDGDKGRVYVEISGTVGTFKVVREGLLADVDPDEVREIVCRMAERINELQMAVADLNADLEERPTAEQVTALNFEISRLMRRHSSAPNVSYTYSADCTQPAVFSQRPWDVTMCDPKLILYYWKDRGHPDREISKGVHDFLIWFEDAATERVRTQGHKGWTQWMSNHRQTALTHVVTINDMVAVDATFWRVNRHRYDPNLKQS